MAFEADKNGSELNWRWSWTSGLDWTGLDKAGRSPHECGEVTVLHRQLHIHFALYLMQFVWEYLTLSQYCSTGVYKGMNVSKQLDLLSSVQGSSLLHELEMLLLFFLMVLINDVVLE